MKNDRILGGKFRINVISFTDAGSRLNFHLGSQLRKKGALYEAYAVKRFAGLYGLHPLESDIQTWIGARWGSDAFLFIGAAGIAIRYIVPWVKDKFTDSPVLVMDEMGEYIIPLLSGHVGGAVEIAREVAALTGAVPVITTATDVQRKFAVDVFASKNGLEIGSRELAKAISAAVLDGKEIGFYSSLPVGGTPPDCIKTCNTVEALKQYPFSIAVTEAHRSKKQSEGNSEAKEGHCIGKEKDGRILWLFSIPQIIVGIGSRRGTRAEQIKRGLLEVLAPLCILPEQIEAIVSIDLKKNEEGLIRLAEEYHVPFRTFPAKELSTIEAVSTRSVFVEQTTGIDNVCERAARYAGQDGELLLPKTVSGGCTYAIVKRQITLMF